MRILLILLLSSTFFQQAIAQKNGEIKGVIVNGDKQPLEKATVSIISEKDSLVLAYSLSTGKGAFSLVKLPTSTDLILHINHVDGSPYFKKIKLASNQKLNLDTITIEGLSLEEVVISYQAPIRLNGDTLEYKADYFKTRPNATVEELLKLLPGLQVNIDGSIIYEGREVSGIRVNNKDFFANDLKIATRNLDASLVDIVQVIKDKGESKREILDDTELPIVINIKTKKAFLKANFGKIYGSGGSRDRYESGALLNSFRDTLQISFIGFANNIGNNFGFDFSELSQYGGLSRGENMAFSSRNYGGLQNKLSAGLNANYDIGKKLKTNLMYNFEQQKDYVKNNTTSQRFFDNIQEESIGNTNTDHSNDLHSIRGLVRYHIDSTSSVSFNTRVNFSLNKSESSNLSSTERQDGTPVSDINGSSFSKANNHNYTHNINAEKKLPSSKILFSIHHTLNTSRNDANNRNISLNHFYLFSDQNIDQEILLSNGTVSKSTNNRLNVQIPIKKKINLDVYTQYDWSEQDNIAGILNRQNSTEFVDRNDIADNKSMQIGNVTYGSRLNLEVFKKMRITASLDRLEQSRHYIFENSTPNIEENRGYWLPKVSVNYNGISLSYNRSVQPPSLYQIIGINSDLYPTSLSIASPYFENQESDQYGVNYFKYFTKSKININGSLNYRTYNNSVASESTYDTENSFSTRKNYQAAGTDNYNLYFNLSKTFVQNKTWTLRLSINGNGSRSTSLSRVNEVENERINLFGNMGGNIDITYKNKITFIPIYSYGINSTENKFESPFFRDMTNATHSFGASLRLDQMKKFRLETAYTLKNQIRNIQNDRLNLHLVNASVYYPVLKNKGELKFTAFDVLNQNQNISFLGGGNTNTYSEQLTLRQHFMFGLVYRFLSTGK